MSFRSELKESCFGRSATVVRQNGFSSPSGIETVGNEGIHTRAASSQNGFSSPSGIETSHRRADPASLLVVRTAFPARQGLKHRLPAVGVHAGEGQNGFSSPSGIETMHPTMVGQVSSPVRTAFPARQGLKQCTKCVPIAIRVGQNGFSSPSGIETTAFQTPTSQAHDRPSERLFQPVRD